MRPSKFLLPLKTAATVRSFFLTASAIGSGKGPLFPMQVVHPYLVGYGCTTCIGNSGPLPEPIADAVKKNDLTVAAVLSGNRNFEGRINPIAEMSYLASP